MKILITGSKGQLARELQLELAGAGKLLALGHNALNLADPSSCGSMPASASTAATRCGCRPCSAVWTK